MKIKAELEINVLSEDIDDIMVSALEGGINYWCDKAEVVGDYLGEYASEQISRGGALRLYECEDNSVVYELTKEKLLKGIGMYLGNPYRPYNILDIRADNGYCINPGNVDAIVADMIVQYAIAGEIIYG